MNNTIIGDLMDARDRDRARYLESLCNFEERMWQMQKLLKHLETVYPFYLDSPEGYCPICLEKKKGQSQPHTTNCEMHAVLAEHKEVNIEE